MTTQEFSNEFDTVLQTIIAQQEEGIQNPLSFDEYEKSVFLTKAQENIVLELYSGRQTGISFEKTEESRRYLSNLILTTTITSFTTGIGIITNCSYFCSIPTDLWFITYESATLEDDALKCGNTSIASVIPVKQDYLYSILNNPFRGPSDIRVLRLDISNDKVELISKYNIKDYTIRYITKPKPIILTNLPDDLKINGEHVKTECKLNSALHRRILDEAVRLAVLSKMPTSNTAQQQ